jgi:hypothetical protein
MVVYMQVTVQEYLQSSVVLVVRSRKSNCGENRLTALFQSSGIGAEQASTSAENQAQRSLVCESHAEEPVFIRLGSCHPMKGASLILPTSKIYFLGLNYTCRKEVGRKEKEEDCVQKEF